MPVTHRLTRTWQPIGNHRHACLVIGAAAAELYWGGVPTDATPGTRQGAADGIQARGVYGSTLYARARAPAICCTLRSSPVAAPAFGDLIAASEPVHWWRFAEASGCEFLPDSAASNATSALYSSYYSGCTPAPNRGAGLVAGSAGSIDLPGDEWGQINLGMAAGSSAFIAGDPRADAFGALILSTTAPLAFNPVFWGQPGTHPTRLYLADGLLRWAWDTPGAPQEVTTTADLADGAPHLIHFGTTADAIPVLYVDGQEAGRGAAIPVVGASGGSVVARIGAGLGSPPFGDYAFGELLFWNRALTPAEIAEQAAAAGLLAA